MIVTAACGCEFDCWVTGQSWGGCCCGECYNSWGDEYTVEDATVTKTCETHGA